MFLICHSFDEIIIFGYLFSASYCRCPLFSKTHISFPLPPFSFWINYPWKFVIFDVSVQTAWGFLPKDVIFFFFFFQVSYTNMYCYYTYLFMLLMSFWLLSLILKVRVTLQQINLNKMFWSKPCSLALAPESPLRVEEPKYDGIKHIIFKLMLFYSKQSKSIRGANVVYRRIISQVEKPLIYEGESFLMLLP